MFIDGMLYTVGILSQYFVSCHVDEDRFTQLTAISEESQMWCYEM